MRSPACISGVDIRYRDDGRLFKLKEKKSFITCEQEFQYAEDHATADQSVINLKRSVNSITKPRVSLVNRKKTKILIQPVPRQTTPDVNISINAEPAEVVDEFPYFCSILLNSAKKY